MRHDVLHAIDDAETEIKARMAQRKGATADARTVAAAETIADELTRLRAELKTLRYLLAAAQDSVHFSHDKVATSAWRATPSGA